MSLTERSAPLAPLAYQPESSVLDEDEESSAAGDRVNGLAAREERLVSVLSRARRSGGLTERWLGAIGAALAVGGLVLVVIGWVGTSRTVLVAGQIPYVVSGGLLGLALVFLGGFVYFGYWLALVVRQGRERAEQDRSDVASLASALVEVNRSLASIAALISEGQGAGNGKAASRRPRS